MNLEELMQTIGKGVEVFGVLIILLGIAISTLTYLQNKLTQHDNLRTYHQYRRGLGRALLLGLEVLVAGDVIRTVAVSPTFESVGVLGMIVLIRTFLSWSLEVELNGHFPWQRDHETIPEQDSKAA